MNEKAPKKHRMLNYPPHNGVGLEEECYLVSLRLKNPSPRDSKLVRMCALIDSHTHDKGVCDHLQHGPSSLAGASECRGWTAAECVCVCGDLLSGPKFPPRLAHA